jgi:hypothetical protein
MKCVVDMLLYLGTVGSCRLCRNVTKQDVVVDRLGLLKHGE